MGVVEEGNSVAEFMEDVNSEVNSDVEDGTLDETLEEEEEVVPVELLDASTYPSAAPFSGPFSETPAM